MIARSLTLCLLWLALALPAAAHEFWIEPLQFQVAPGEVVEAHFVNGEKFEGVQLGYFDRNSARLQMEQGGHLTDLAPRNGDKPALNLPVDQPGLLVVVHETTPSRLRYKTWEKFAKFAAHKDFPDIAARHDARGLPRSDFSETYSRHAKALVAVGGGAGEDRAFGLETEIVALTNPYLPEFTGTMAVRVLYRGAPRADAQVEIFERAPDGSVTVSLTRTDADGRATLTTRPGYSYLLDAVVLREADPAFGTVWESLWASLTFAVPAR